MLAYINNAAANVRRRLFQLDQQPVGKTTLIVLIFLDIFILTAIFEGLSDHTRQLTSPEEYIPQVCRNIVINRHWHVGNQVERVGNLVNNYHERGRDMPNVGESHPICAELANRFDAVRSDPELISLLKRLSEIEQQLIDASQRIERVRGTYDTNLNARLADAESDDQVAALENRVREQTRLLNQLEESRAEMYEQLSGNESFTALTSAIEGSTLADREQLAADYRMISRWFPLKRLGMEAIFILPIILVFWLWNARSLANNRSFQTLVSTHLLVIAFIPLIMKFGELIYDVLPRQLLVKVMELLERFGLVAVWHYLLMAVVIGIALTMIYVFQKKLFSTAREQARRITRGLCQQCGSRLPDGSAACSICGFQQFQQCTQCGEPTWVFGPYCRSCGTAQ